MRKQANVFVEVEKGIPIHSKNVMPYKGLKSKKELTYDTLENRYVKWMMKRLEHKLIDLLETVQKMNKYIVEPDPDLILKITKMIAQLQTKMKNHFWSRIGKLDRSIMSLVLQMAPGYRDAFQIFLTVSKGLALQGKLYQMSVKDVATLYEYWTFLKLGQILGRKYTLVSQDIIQVNREGLFVNLQANRMAKRVFKHPMTKEEIVLTYQKYEGKLPTIPQKPDTMLSIEKKGKDYTFNYIFDAKYRIDYAQEGSYYKNRYKTPGPMEDDINTMHRYRDSIVAENNGPYERTAFGAYVLFPCFDEYTYQSHHFYQSINKVNIGGLPFLPNATMLVEQFIEWLINKSPEEIQKEGILPRGTLEEWKSSLDEIVLVGLVSNGEDYLRFIREGYYSIPVSKLKKGWQGARYVALYVKNGIEQQKNGIKYYGKIEGISTAKFEGFDCIKFYVSKWITLKNIIKPVGYGISSYMLTTLNNLKESTELPELFMKSSVEMIIWRMMRRVSDKIILNLDNVNVDHATQVTYYKIRNILVSFDKVEQSIKLVSDLNEFEVSTHELKRNPSGVFKLLNSIY